MRVSFKKKKKRSCKLTNASCSTTSLVYFVRVIFPIKFWCTSVICLRGKNGEIINVTIYSVRIDLNEPSRIINTYNLFIMLRSEYKKLKSRQINKRIVYAYARTAVE